MNTSSISITSGKHGISSISISSGKHGINLGAGNAPSNYLDIVIPTGATTNAITVANTLGGAPIAYVDVSGNAAFQGLNCTQLNVTTYCIILPTT